MLHVVFREGLPLCRLQIAKYLKALRIKPRCDQYQGRGRKSIVFPMLDNERSGDSIKIGERAQIRARFIYYEAIILQPPTQVRVIEEDRFDSMSEPAEKDAAAYVSLTF